MPSLRETSGATTQLTLEYVHERGGDAAVGAVLERAAIPYTRAQLESASTWVSYDERIRLFEATVAVLDEPDAMFQVGARALRSNVNQAIGLLLRALGSARAVFGHLPGAVSKFSTTSTMRILELEASRARIDYRLHEGYEHSRLDCRYAQGLFSVVPEIFGLPPAMVAHEQCQSDGHATCIYEVTWQKRARRPWRRRREARVRTTVEAKMLRAHLGALQSATADVVSGADLRTVLQRLAERAASAVIAQGHLLVVEDPYTGRPLVQAAGIGAERSERLAQRLLAGEDLGPSAVVADVVSARYRHGRLAALYADGQRGLTDEHQLLSTYARQAAAALDTYFALEDARRGEARASALLELSGRLVGCQSAQEVADVVATAVPGIVGAPTASVLFWDEAQALLVPAAAGGLDDARRDALLRSPISPAVSPTLEAMLREPQPRLLAADEAEPFLRDLMGSLDVQGIAITPMLGDGRLLGVVSAQWQPSSEVNQAELAARLSGVASQAVPALINAELVATVRHQSRHDGLTQLPNRECFLDRARRLADGRRRSAMLFCDLDRLKKVNDTLGHAAGDELLRQVATRLGECVRDGDIVARLSGDEFCVLLPDVEDVAVARAVADRIVAALEHPFGIDDNDLIVTVSVGIAHDDAGGAAPDELLRRADEAMYQAKRRGRNQVAHLAGPAEHPDVSTLRLEADLAGALEADGLAVAFQPLVDLASSRTIGYEALARWPHPWRGQLSPADFVPLAEAAGLAAKLDFYVLRRAVGAAADWYADGEELSVAVNLSRPTLADPRLPATVLAALQETGLPPHLLELEVTENGVGGEPDAVQARLHELKAIGVRLALDDFGTGQSGIAWLHRFPVDRVKIDRSFVAGFGSDRVARALVEGIIALGRGLGLEILAEGVETDEHREQLLAAGCGFGQGWLFGRPETVPAHAALDRVA